MNIKLDDLEVNNYMIYQDRDAFCFGLDSVLLSNFFLKNINVVNDSINICDLCSGNLIIPLIIYAKRKKYKFDKIKISTFEIDKDQVIISNKSLDYNLKNDDCIKDDIKVYNDDIKNIIINKEKYKNIYNTFDAITVNPPYIKSGSGEFNENDKISVAKHEVYLSFNDIVEASKLLLKSNKKLFIIHRTERLTEISNILYKNDFRIKTLQFIHPKKNKPSNLVLIIAIKGAKDGLKVLEPIVVFDEKDKYTSEILSIYGKDVFKSLS